MNPEHYVRIKKEVNHDREIPAIVDPNIIVIDSDDDTITYASSSRSLPPEPSASNAINNEIRINRTHEIIEIDVRDDSEIDLTDVDNIIIENKLIIEKYKEGSKLNKQHNVINDNIIKGEFPTIPNTELLKNKKRQCRNETIHKFNEPSSVQDDIILTDDEVIHNLMISNASNSSNRASMTQYNDEIIPRRNCASEAVINLPSPTTISNHEQNIITCPVCLTSLSGNRIISTTCGHIFCMDCIQSVLSSNNKKCPTCRKKITKKGYHQIYI